MQYDITEFDKFAEYLLAVTGSDMVGLSPDYVRMMGFDPDDVRKYSRMVLPVAPGSKNKPDTSDMSGDE